MCYFLSVMKKAVKHFLNKHFPITRFTAVLPYTLVFKTTNYCWYKCPHCCENSGPKQPRDFIPANLIKYYLSVAAGDSRFSGDVVFTGGEIMAAYRFGAPGYVKDILDYALGLNCGVDIKTNAAWTGLSFGGPIFDDLAAVAAAHKQYRLQVSLSLDGFHKNALDNNVRFISQMAARGAKIVVHISGLDGKWFVSPDAVYGRLRDMGHSVSAGGIVSGNRLIDAVIVDGCVVVRSGVGELFQAGRANNIDGAAYQATPQFQIISHGNDLLMAFDSAGRVSLGEAGRRKIATKWRAGAGRIFKLPSIQKNLTRAAFVEEMRHKILGR